MAYSDIVSDFTGILNRDDNTATNTQLFVRQSMDRIQRESDGKLHYLERSLTVSPPFGKVVVNSWPITVAAAGSGYPLSATFNLTLSGGTLATGGTAAVVSVTSNTAGQVATVNGLLVGGPYTTAPASPSATSGAPSGSGCTLAFTTVAAPFHTTPVPTDLVQVIDLITPNQCGIPSPLDKVSYRQLVTKDPLCWPHWYARYNGYLYLAGNVPPTQQVSLLYYGRYTALAVDGGGAYTSASTNEFTDNCPELLTYGALTYAADFWNIDKRDAWDRAFTSLLNAELEKTRNLELEGGPMVVAPIYGDLDA